LKNSDSIKTALKKSGRLDSIDQADILNRSILIEAEIQEAKSALKKLESSLAEPETDRILNGHSENVYNGIRKNLISKINQTKISIERCQNEISLLNQNNNWIDSIESLGGYLNGFDEVDETKKRDVLKHLVKDIIVTYNHDNKCHNLKVKLNVPLIMGYERDAEASRRTLCVGERSSQPQRRKPNIGHDYSTVTDLARFLGWSTLHPRITAI